MSFYTNLVQEIERRELEIETLKAQLKHEQKQLKGLKQLRADIEATHKEYENEQV